MGTTVFAGLEQGFFRSNDKGNTWSEVNLEIGTTRVLALMAMDNAIFAGTGGRGLFRSEDGGNSWTPVNRGLKSGSIMSLAVMGTTLFAGTYESGVFRSDDKGETWVEVNTGLKSKFIRSLAVMDTTLFVSTTEGGGVFRSDDKGNSWTEINKGLIAPWGKIYPIGSLAVMGMMLYAGTGGGGVFRFNDEDNTWIPVNKGLTNKDVTSLAVMGNTLFAGAGGSGVFRASLSETAVAVEQKGKLVTAWGKLKTALFQNYPNPFNPETWIPFSLAENSEVTIRIYDIKGQLVKALNLGHKERGLYLSKDKAAHWDGRNERGELVASGIYFVKLKTERYQQVRRMILIK